MIDDPFNASCSLRQKPKSFCSSDEFENVEMYESPFYLVTDLTGARILRITWPGAGKKQRAWEFTNEETYQKVFYKGSIPGFERGVSLEVIENDRSASFRKKHNGLVARGL